jgi:hypothetical protein
MQLTHRYQDAAAICASGGYEWVADLVRTEGLPLEILHIGHGRLWQLDVLDYEEGQEQPLTWVQRYWWEVLHQPPSLSTGWPQYMIVAVGPDGLWKIVEAHGFHKMTSDDHQAGLCNPETCAWCRRGAGEV